MQLSLCEVLELMGGQDPTPMSGGLVIPQPGERQMQPSPPSPVYPSDGAIALAASMREEQQQLLRQHQQGVEQNIAAASAADAAAQQHPQPQQQSQRPPQQQQVLQAPQQQQQQQQLQPPQHQQQQQQQQRPDVPQQPAQQSLQQQQQQHLPAMPQRPCPILPEETLPPYSELPDLWRVTLCEHGPQHHLCPSCNYAHSLSELVPPDERIAEIHDFLFPTLVPSVYCCF